MKHRFGVDAKSIDSAVAPDEFKIEKKVGMLQIQHGVDGE